VQRHLKTARVRPRRRRRMPGEETSELAKWIERRWIAMLPRLVSEALVLRFGGVQNERSIVAGRPVTIEPFGAHWVETEFVQGEQAQVRTPTEPHAASSTPLPAPTSVDTTQATGQKPAVRSEVARSTVPAPGQSLTVRPPGFSEHHGPEAATERGPESEGESQTKTQHEGQPAIAGSQLPVAGEAAHATTPVASTTSTAPPVTPDATQGGMQEAVTTQPAAHSASQPPPVPSESAGSTASASTELIVRSPGWHERPAEDSPTGQTSAGGGPSQPVTAQAGQPGEGGSTATPTASTPSATPAPAPAAAQREAQGAGAKAAEEAELVRQRTVGPPRRYDEIALALPSSPATPQSQAAGSTPNTDEGRGSPAVRTESPAGTSQTELIHVAPQQSTSPPSSAVGQGAPSAPASPAVPSSHSEGMHAVPAAPSGARPETTPQHGKDAAPGGQTKDQDELIRQVLKQFAHEMAWEAERRGRPEWG
jgi:hypothetical protein